MKRKATCVVVKKMVEGTFSCREECRDAGAGVIGSHDTLEGMSWLTAVVTTL